MGSPTYADSEGNRYTTSEIDRRSDKVAKKLQQDQLDEYGYNFCTKCFRNDCKPIDVAHAPVSKKEAKESGRSELCWDKSNLNIWGRKCHAKHDKLNIQSGKLVNKHKL